MQKCASALIIMAGIVAASFAASGGEVTRADLESLVDSKVSGWRFIQGEVPGAEGPGFDDSAWEPVEVGHQWNEPDSTAWYRTTLVMPARINGSPAQGGTVRIKLAMDNRASAYVNGEFKQEFSWDGGDVSLTTDARPGETFCIALHAINGPGYGSLYQASLICSSSEEMVEGVRDLLKSFDIVESHVAEACPETVAHWHDRIDCAVQKLDLSAYRAGENERFLASLGRAHDALFADLRSLDRDLRGLRRDLGRLRRLIEEGQEAGRRMAYQRIDARVIESFIDYIQEDIEDQETAHTVRALMTLSFLNRTCDEAIGKAKALLAGPSSPEPVVPVYHTGPIEIRDGSFWQEDRPIFFTGVGHFSQVRKDIPILPEYGLNIIQIETGPSRVVTDYETVDETSIREDILPALDRAAAHNVMVNLLISPHYFPAWALERYPHLADCGAGFLKNCLEAPEARRIYELYLRALMPLIVNHPALHSICLSNEPQYDGRCLHSRVRFHEWLRVRYPSIAALNEVYGSSYASFDEVPFPAKNEPDYALYYDYYCFNQDRFLEFHHFLRDLVHEYDRDIPVHAKTMSDAFDDPSRFRMGINFEDFTLLGGISGNDCWQYFPRNGERLEYAQHWRDTAMNYTLQRAFAPAQPIFNSEDHIITDGEWRHIPSAHIRSAYWVQALHGQGAATTWVWERGQEGDLEGNILTRANCVRALGYVAADLNRLAWEVHALQGIQPEYAILYAYSSIAANEAHAEGCTAAFEGAYFVDAPCGFVSERQAIAGKAGAFKLLIVPCATHVSDEVVQALQAYIEAGGRVLTIGECFTHDAHGRPRTAGLAQAGTGRLITYPEPLSPRAYRELLDPLLDETGCERLLRLRGPYGEPVWGVNLRAAEYQGQRLASLVNFARRDQAIVLEGEGRIKKAVDLFSGEEVVFPLTLRSLDPALLLLEMEAE